MTQQQMLEIIKEQFPNTSDAELRIYLNNVSKDFCSKSKILMATAAVTSATNQRVYSLESNVIEVQRVVIDNEAIPRLVGEPDKEDIT